MIKPKIASSINIHNDILTTLTPKHLGIVEKLARNPVKKQDIEDNILNDLLDMHIIVLKNQYAKINTAVFLEDDMKNIIDLAAKFSNMILEILSPINDKFSDVSPEIKNLLLFTIGVSQGITKSLKEKELILDWQKYKGKYPCTKVDFDEICPSYNMLGKDHLNKSVLRGNFYTSVFIGNLSNHYIHAFISQNIITTYIQDLMKFLTDSFGMLFHNKIYNPSLISCAKELEFYNENHLKQLLITKNIYYKYHNIIQYISNSTFEKFELFLPYFNECLENTNVGKQGVSNKNMMEHFWRYIRMILANELYKNKILTDEIPIKGVITVFYENNIKELNSLLL